VADLLVRLARRTKIREVFAARWEVTDRARDVVRRLEVHLACAEACGVRVFHRERLGPTVAVAFARDVTDVVAELGGVPTTADGRKWFTRVRLRSAADQVAEPPKKLTARERWALVRAWEKRLAEEGLAYLNVADPRDVEERRADRLASRAVAAGMVQQMTDFYWLARADLEVFQLWAIDGLDIGDIAARTGQSSSVVHRTLQRLRAEMPARLATERQAAARRGGPGRPRVDQETGHGDEQGSSPKEDRRGTG
jgi:DNA-directed RNA polymerase specialized sigma24 family protein